MNNSNKPTIVLLHGWGSNGSSSWKNNESALRQAGFSCLSMQLPGFDLPEPNTPWGVPEYSEYVVKKLAELGITPPYILVGHSFGGRLCICIASKHPELVSSLILSDAAGVANRRTPKLIFVKILSNIFKVLDPIPFVNMASRAIRKKVFSRTASPDYTRATPMMREILKKVVALDLKSHLKKIKARTLIVWGEQDDVTPWDEAQTLNKGIKGSKLILIPNTGHHAHSAKYLEWNSHVLIFLQTEVK